MAFPQHLDNDVLTRVLFALNVADVGCAAYVCSPWAQAVRQEGLWRELCKRDSPSNDHQPPARYEGGWRSTYRHLFLEGYLSRFGRQVPPKDGAGSGLPDAKLLMVGSERCGKTEFAKCFRAI